MAVQATASHAILERLAAEGRRVLSPWRAAVLLRRATVEIPPHERRWQQFPQSPDDIAPLLRQMRSRGEIRSIERHRQLFEVIVPYARQGFIDEREILFELHPYCAISHLSAMVFHGLTTDQPRGLTISVPASEEDQSCPIGTLASDWDNVLIPKGIVPTELLGRPVRARRVRPPFAWDVFTPYRYPLRYTTVERTLIDGLISPELCGGIGSVLAAWATAADFVDFDRVVSLVDRLDIAILRQRAGFVLSELGYQHPRFTQWQAMSRRGGSSRLVASEPFAPTYDERWNLSVNVPVGILQDVA